MIWISAILLVLAAFAIVPTSIFTWILFGVWVALMTKMILELEKVENKP